MIKRIFVWMLILGAVAFGIVILLGGVAALYLASQTQVSIPTVNIHTPGHGDQVGLGQFIPVHSTSGDEDNQIIAVELWELQGEQLRMIEVDEPLEPESTFSVPQGWQPLSTGSHRLIVRAFNDQGDYGQASVDVEVVEMPEGAEAELAEGEILPAPGGLDQETSGMYGSSAEGIEGVIIPPQPNPDPPSDNLGVFLQGQILQGLGDLFTPQVLLTQVEVEALDFEVVEPYEKVWCYVSLASSPHERIPESGFFDTTDQFHWNIADYLGGNNRVELSLLRNQLLDIDLECWGDRNNQPYLIGRLVVSHPPEDWNGQLIHSASQGGEGFTVSYRIEPAESDLEAPLVLTERIFFQQKHFLWYWPGDEAEIDGFRIYRDEILIASVPPDLRSYAMAPWWTVPPCSEEYQYHVVAYRDNLESPPSNFLNYQGDVCGVDDDIVDIQARSVCAGAGKKINIQYIYSSSNGDASIGIRDERVSCLPRTEDLEHHL